jgi:hypothetical protein
MKRYRLYKRLTRQEQVIGATAKRASNNRTVVCVGKSEKEFVLAVCL